MALSERTQAFVNLYAGIGVLEKYLELDESAKSLQNNTMWQFVLKLRWARWCVDIKNGACKVYPYEEGVKTNVVLYFDSCDKFNRLVAGEKVMPIPTKEF